GGNAAAPLTDGDGVARSRRGDAPFAQKDDVYRECRNAAETASIINPSTASVPGDGAPFGHAGTTGG
ncbi:hypothetical protein, partial [Anaerotruncus colihominis]|uniref:hypothetical protein n=1 Tax=Anaerotruncus colihominis TaxID=169435 RepID=UPI00242B5985